MESLWDRETFDSIPKTQKDCAKKKNAIWIKKLSLKETSQLMKGVLRKKNAKSFSGKKNSKKIQPKNETNFSRWKSALGHPEGIPDFF